MLRNISYSLLLFLSICLNCCANDPLKDLLACYGSQGLDAADRYIDGLIFPLDSGSKQIKLASLLDKVRHHPQYQFLAELLLKRMNQLLINATNRYNGFSNLPAHGNPLSSQLGEIQPRSEEIYMAGATEMADQLPPPLNRTNSFCLYPQTSNQTLPIFIGTENTLRNLLQIFHTEGEDIHRVISILPASQE